MICPLCKGNVTEGKTNVTYGMGDDHILVISQVPAKVCDQCGEIFIDIRIVRQIEVMVENARKDGVTHGFLKYRQAA